MYVCVLAEMARCNNGECKGKSGPAGKSHKHAPTHTYTQLTRANMLLHARDMDDGMKALATYCTVGNRMTQQR